MKNLQSLTHTIISKHPNILWILLLALFLKQIVFLAVVPLWHTPDEQAHFAQIAYYSEFGTMPVTGHDLNREIWVSEKLLGTERNERGENKFTYHPEYRIEYSDSYLGKYEEEIKSLQVSFRKEVVKQEAANYPPLYYEASSLIYRIFYSNSLIDRVYAVRILSLLLGIGTVYISFLIGRLIFEDDILKQIVLTALIGFHPMFSFVSVGVNSDNLFNLFFTLLIFYCLKIIKEGVFVKTLITTFLVLSLMYLTKPQFLFGIGIFILAISYRYLVIEKVRAYLKVGILMLLLCLSTPIFFLVKPEILFSLNNLIGYLSTYSPGGIQTVNISFWEFLKITVQRTLAETIPWYWGVFNWLGVVLPRDVNRIINRIMVVATIGLGVYLIKVIIKKRRVDHLIIFSLIISGVYFLGITLYNYIFTLSHGFSFGIQGRYFFPVIVTHMILLVVGLINFLPNKIIPQRYILWTIFILIILLNLIGIYTVIKSYYNISDLDIFITQYSQYKPEILKGDIILWLISLSILSLIILVGYSTKTFLNRSRLYPSKFGL